MALASGVDARNKFFWFEWVMTLKALHGAAQARR